MSEPRTVLLAGASGLVGGQIVALAARRSDLRLVALTRRPIQLPAGVAAAVADADDWPATIAAIAPEAVICALGTTLRQAGSEQAFRAVDHDLVVAVASAAKASGAGNFVMVSSVAASRAARSFYLRVKGEAEGELTDLNFERLDILRPGLLRGNRGERRWRESLAIAASPVTDALLPGPLRRFRSIRADVVAAAAVSGALARQPGTFVHEYDTLLGLAQSPAVSR